jgi:hypothetical protein
VVILRNLGAIGVRGVRIDRRDFVGDTQAHLKGTPYDPYGVDERSIGPTAKAGISTDH